MLERADFIHLIYVWNNFRIFSIPILEMSDDFGLFFSRTFCQGVCDIYMENPFQISGPRGANEAKNMEEGMYVRMEMPGIDKEDVKVLIVYGNITIKGEGKKESTHEDSGRTYSANIEICSDSYQPQFMEANMKNGVLRMLIPKSKNPQEVTGSYEIKVKFALEYHVIDLNR